MNIGLQEESLFQAEELFSVEAPDKWKAAIVRWCADPDREARDTARDGRASADTSGRPGRGSCQSPRGAEDIEALSGEEGEQIPLPFVSEQGK